MADYHVHFSVMLPIGSAGNVAPTLALYRRLAKELDRQGQTIGFAARADDEPGSPELWLHDGGCVDIEHVITFALRCAEAFGL